MTQSLQYLNSQIEKTEPGGSEMIILLESIQELTDRAEALNLYDCNDKQSMIEYLRIHPFYEGIDLDAMPKTYLRKWCAEITIDKICWQERVRKHHDEEFEGGLE